MPANLTPQYLDAEQRFKAAETLADKLSALRHMMAVIPKHKGTEKLRAELRRKLSRLQDEIEAARSRKGGGRPEPGHVPHEGAGQIALVGAPNSGKSSLLAALTGAHPKIADYPFTTLEPQCGMMDFEDVQIQLVDTPGVSREFVEPWLSELVRRADRVALVVDLGSDTVLEDTEVLFAWLRERRVRLVVPHGDAEPDEAREETTMAGASQEYDDIEAHVVANRCDLAGAADRLELVREILDTGLGTPLTSDALHVVSATTRAGLDVLPRALFEALRIVRVYTKTPGNKPDHEKPFVLLHGATVLDLAETIHKDIAASLKFARLWGSGRFDGQAVQRDHVLEDRDIVEIHS